ncbi:MAG: hypothetical protein JST93_03745 [Acidobacteria bacterium]|nr:hypothetical protein [Acidobacteriota bacterium]
MTAPYEVSLPGGLKLTVELADRPVDFEIFVPAVGTIVFQRDKGPFPAVKGKVNRIGIPAAKYKKHLRADTSIDKHEVLTASGDSIMYSDPEM